MRSKDVRECVTLVATHPVIGPRYADALNDLRAVWLALLGREAFRAVVFEDSQQSRPDIVGIGVSAFVSDEFLHSQRRPPFFWVGPELTRRISRGESPLLSDRAMTHLAHMQRSKSILSYAIALTCVIGIVGAVIGCDGGTNPKLAEAQGKPRERLGTTQPPSGWYKFDAGAFSLFAPAGWEFHQLPGVDSYVGEFVGDGVVLRFDFGGYSNPLNEEKKPAYVVVHESIGGLRAKIVSSKTPGNGVTGVYFPNVGHSNELSLFAKDLTSTQQELVLKIFETIRFGGPVPRYVVPPPPAKSGT